MVDDQFAAAIEDSHYLLAFLSRRCLVLDEHERAQFKAYAASMAKVQALVAASQDVSPEDRAAFWDSFIWLSNLATPATIESIRYYFSYYYGARQPVWRLLRKPFARPKQRAKTGGRWFFSAFTLTTFFAALLLSLAGFVGNRTLEQFSKDYQYWYQVATISRALSYGFEIDATSNTDDRGITVTLRPPRDQPKPAVAAHYPGTRTASAILTTAVTDPGSDAPPIPGQLNQVRIPEERVAQLRSAFPQMFAQRNKLSRLDDWIWTPICTQPALGERALPAGRSPSEPCFRVRDVILAEELTATLSGMNTERAIMQWLTAPMRWALNVRDAAPGNNGPQTVVRSPDIGASRPVVSTAPEDDRCLPGPSHMPDPKQLASLTNDLPTMKQIFLTILCHDRPLPMILPPPLQNMLDMPFKARLTLDVVNTYLLTLLFGMLGAAVQVMRDIHRRLDDFTLTRVALSCYKVRLILGAVAGPFVGLFINLPSGVTSALNADPQLMTRLTGLGLAFLAGFSVDLLFGMLERLTALLSEVSPGSHPGQAIAARRVVNNRVHSALS